VCVYAPAEGSLCETTYVKGTQPRAALVVLPAVRPKRRSSICPISRWRVCPTTDTCTRSRSSPKEGPQLIDRWVVDPMRFETRGNSPRSAGRIAATVGRNKVALDFIAANHHLSNRSNFGNDRESPDPGRICASPRVGLNERAASTASKRRGLTNY
jgi:hypothetical protein